MDATRWANAPATPTEEISWRSRTRDDDGKDDSEDSPSKDLKDDEEEEERDGLGSDSRESGGRERSDVWRPGGGNEVWYYGRMNDSEIGILFEFTKRAMLSFPAQEIKFKKGL